MMFIRIYYINIRLVFTSLIFCFTLLQQKNYAQVNFEWVNQNIGGLLLAIDSNNNIYTARGFISPFLIGDTLLVPKGTQDFYVTKIDENGNYIWVLQFGGNNKTYVSDIKTDRFNNLFVVGYFTDSTDFDPYINQEFYLSSKTGTDVFICKLNENGELIWAKQLESNNNIETKFIRSAEESNSVYVSGIFKNSTIDFNPNSMDTFLLTSGSDESIYLSKYDENGEFIWATSCAKSKYITLNDISIVNEDFVYLVGDFRDSITFDPNNQSVKLYSPVTSWSSFYTKFDKNGNFIWAKVIYPQAVNMSSTSSFVNSKDELIICGRFNGIVDFNPSIDEYFLNADEGASLFILALNKDGEFIWAKQLKSDSDILGNKTIKDKYDNIFLTGYFAGKVDFNPNESENFYLNAAGNTNAFVCKLDDEGKFLWVKQFGTKVNEIHYSSISTVQSMIVSNNLEIYTTGQFYNFPQDFDPSETNQHILNPNDGTSFIHKMKEWSVSIESPTNNFHNDILVYPNPNSGVFNIETQQETVITIKNILGQLVYQQTIYNNTQIDLSKNNKGIYILDARQEEKFFRTKLIFE
jgi:hypothetical protein